MFRVSFLLIALLIVGCTPKIIIGLVISHSPGSEESANIQQAIAAIALEDAAQLVVESGKKVDVVITGIDTKNNVELAKAAIVKLKSQGARFLLGLATSAEVEETKDQIVKNDMIAISTAETAELLSEEDNSYSLAPGDESQTMVFAKILEDANVKHLGIMDRQDVYGTGLARSVGLALTDKLISSSPFPYPTDQQNFSPFIDSLNVDIAGAVGKQSAALFVSFDEFISIIQEARKPSYAALSGVPWYGTDGIFESKPFLLATNEAQFALDRKLKCTGVIINDKYKEKFADLQRRLNEKIPNATITAFDANLYDGLLLIVKTTLENDSKAPTADLKHGLEAMAKNMIGVTGPLEFNSLGNRAIWTYGLHKLTKNPDNTFAWQLEKTYDSTQF